MAEKTDGEYATSMDDVAKRAGVSQSTVSRALRGSSKVRPETRERIRAVARELGFAPSRSASSLASGKLRRIAVLIGSPLVDWFSGSLLDGIYPILTAAGYDVMLYRVHDAEERAAFFDTLPAERNADALIVASFALNADEHAKLAAMRMPIVYLNQSDVDELSVSIDDEASARTAVRHLLRLGHRRIAFLRHEPLPGFKWSASKRYDGYAAELRASGIVPEPDLHIVVQTATEMGAQSLAAILHLDPAPTAVFAENDAIALRLLIALTNAGLRCPEDISIIGFDDQDMAVVHGLTTVAQPVTRLAEAAAEAALARARGESAVSITMPTQLVLRSSTRRIEPDGR